MAGTSTTELRNLLAALSAGEPVDPSTAAWLHAGLMSFLAGASLDSSLGLDRQGFWRGVRDAQLARAYLAMGGQPGVPLVAAAALGARFQRFCQGRADTLYERGLVETALTADALTFELTILRKLQLDAPAPLALPSSPKRLRDAVLRGLETLQTDNAVRARRPQLNPVLALIEDARGVGSDDDCSADRGAGAPARSCAG
jgi:hypothetical protein